MPKKSFVRGVGLRWFNPLHFISFKIWMSFIYQIWNLRGPGLNVWQTGLPQGSQISARLFEVTEEAWRLKERESQLDEPPMFWLRGNRVYDFHGDRGSVADFEADLLTREVEDDATCRSRRQSLGGMGL